MAQLRLQSNRLTPHTSRTTLSALRLTHSGPRAPSKAQSISLFPDPSNTLPNVKARKSVQCEDLKGQKKSGRETRPSPETRETRNEETGRNTPRPVLLMLLRDTALLARMLPTYCLCRCRVRSVLRYQTHASCGLPAKVPPGQRKWHRNRRCASSTANVLGMAPEPPVAAYGTR